MSSMPATRTARSTGRTHLAKLAEALGDRGWRVALSPHRSDPVLMVTGPEGRPCETVVCRPAGDGTWHYQWGRNLGRSNPANRAHFTAVRIDGELRGEG